MAVTNTVNLSGTLKNFTLASQWLPSSITEAVRLDITLSAGVVDLAVPLPGLTTQKIIIVVGGRGVTARWISTVGESMDATLLVVVSDGGMSHPTIYLSNTDTIDHDISVIAAA